MQRAATFDDFFKLSSFFYTTIGIEPYDQPGVDEKKPKSFAAHLIFYSGSLNLNYVLIMEIAFVIVSFVRGENILEAIMCLSYIGFVVVGESKMFFVFRKKPILSKFVKRLVEIYPRELELQERYNLSSYLRQSTRVTISFALLYMILIWTYNLYAMTQYLLYDKWLGTRMVGQQLPYFTYTWWDWHGHWSYYLLYFVHVFAGYTSATGQIASDIMLCGFATQIIMHFNYISNVLTNYKVKINDAKNVDKARQEDIEFLKDIIEYHNTLLDLSEQLNSVFSLPLLLNFSASSFVICFVGFQMTIGVEPDTLIKLFLFLFSSTAQVYLICHYSQMLIDASLNVADAVYNQNWSIADVRYQKMLILMAERAQKPVQLRATTLVLISRGTMTEIMQLSYKFFALLRTMYTRT
ncbi:odorant receptor 85b-like [Musca vetustissima]|uniref:odorant receptor 85b-like n=1 Tax=Musca vetustissima TaxID=27455 RepID=UPI002AB64D82|nr:odorant receptor 85b-like [Musca vetustissima]